MEIIQIDKSKKDNVKKDNVKKETSNINFNLIHDNHPLIWLMDPTYTKPQISSETMPSAIGGIATFTEKNLHLNTSIKLFKYPERFAEELEKTIPDIIGFSNYMWNSELSFSLAKRLKKLNLKLLQ